MNGTQKKEEFSGEFVFICSQDFLPLFKDSPYLSYMIFIHYIKSIHFLKAYKLPISIESYLIKQIEQKLGQKRDFPT